jgi:transketolase
VTPYEASLLDLLSADERVIVLTAENRAPLRNIIPALGRRFVDVGIAEQTLIGMAAGLAARGRIPVVHALSAFLTMRAFEFIRTDVGIPGLPVVMVGFVPGFLSEANGPTHQALEDVALMRLIPGVNVFCPSDIVELSEYLPELVRSGSPWYVRFTASPRIAPGDPDGGELLNGPTVVLEGEDVCIITYGPLLAVALEAAALLAGSGVSAAVVHCPVLKPVRPDDFTRIFRRFTAVVTLEDHFRTGGLSSIVMELAGAEAPHAAAAWRLPVIVPLTLGDRWFRPGLLNDVHNFQGFSPVKVAGFVANVLSREVRSYA